jgi:drug/metabolite transporter (DMT)-like permease
MVSWLAKTSPENQGAFLLVLGVAIFGFADNLTLMVSDQVGVGQFHFSRSIITLGLVVIFSHIFGYSLRPKLWRPLLARTGFIVFSMLIYFSVIPMMPIAEAGAGLFTSPIFVLLFSSFLFKEKIGWRRTFAVFIGTIGVLLIIQPGIGAFSIYHLLPVLSGASYAFGSIITYRYLSNESPMAILFSFLLAIGLCGALVSSAFTIFPVSNVFLQKAPFLFSGWRPLEASFWMWITIIAICTFLALSLMTKAYQIAKTSYAAIYEYAYLLSAGIFSWAFWNVTPNIMGFWGIMLIVIAGIVIALAQQDT